MSGHVGGAANGAGPNGMSNGTYVPSNDKQALIDENGDHDDPYDGLPHADPQTVVDMNNHNDMLRSYSSADVDPMSGAMSGSFTASGTFHCHTVKAPNSKRARNQLIAVTVLSAIFLAAELTGGLLSNSLALVTDATHMACDLSGFLVSLFAIWVATKPPTERMSMGYYRAEVIGALISILIIWVTTAVLLYLAVKRFIDPVFDINADDMLITAGLGVAFNIVMMLILNSGKVTVKLAFGHNHSHGGHGHSHNDGHSHEKHSHNIHTPSHIGDVLPGDVTPDAVQVVDANGVRTRNGLRLDRAVHENVMPDSQLDRAVHENVMTDSQLSDPLTASQRTASAKKAENINVRAAFIHVIGDFIQSIGVLIAAFVIKFKPEYKLADPICTFLFSLLVMCTTIAILRDALSVLMEGVPRSFQYKEAKKDLRRIAGVRSVHSLSVWSLTMDKVALAVHIAVSCEANRDEVLAEATSLLREEYGVHMSTIQIEKYEEDLMLSCEQCTGPTASA